jgi:hypothetical protein
LHKGTVSPLNTSMVSWGDSFSCWLAKKYFCTFIYVFILVHDLGDASFENVNMLHIMWHLSFGQKIMDRPNLSTGTSSSLRTVLLFKFHSIFAGALVSERMRLLLFTGMKSIGFVEVWRLSEVTSSKKGNLGSLCLMSM